MNVSRRLFFLSTRDEGEDGKGELEGRGEREFWVCVGKWKMKKGEDDQQPRLRQRSSWRQRCGGGGKGEGRCSNRKEKCCSPSITADKRPMLLCSVDGRKCVVCTQEKVLKKNVSWVNICSSFGNTRVMICYVLVGSEAPLFI